MEGGSSDCLMEPSPHSTRHCPHSPHGKKAVGCATCEPPLRPHPRLSAPLHAPPLFVPRAQEELVNNTELVQSYRQQIGNVVNQANLQLFWNMYNRCGRCGAQLCGPRH